LDYRVYFNEFFRWGVIMMAAMLKTAVGVVLLCGGTFSQERELAVEDTEPRWRWEERSRLGLDRDEYGECCAWRSLDEILEITEASRTFTPRTRMGAFFNWLDGSCRPLGSRVDVYCGAEPVYEVETVRGAVGGVVRGFCCTVSDNYVRSSNLEQEIMESIGMGKIVEGFLRQPKDVDLFTLESIAVCTIDDDVEDSGVEDWAGRIHRVRVVADETGGRRKIVDGLRRHLEVYGECEFKPREGDLFMRVGVVTRIVVALDDEIKKHSSA
jgi:hypothetical protein